MLKIGDILICTKSVSIEGNPTVYFKKGDNYTIVGISEKHDSIFLLDNYGTKRPIATHTRRANSVCVYWKDYFTCRELKLAELLDN
jgi:hypothetical protein